MDDTGSKQRETEHRPDGLPILEYYCSKIISNPLGFGLEDHV